MQQVRKEYLEARKAKDTLKVNLLSTLIGEVEMVAKNDGNREVNEKDLLAGVKKFLKGINESIAAREKAGGDTADLVREKEILESYMPAQLSEADLEKIIGEIVAGLPEKSIKMMGKVMGELNQKHGGAFDGKLASNLVKKALGA